MKSRTKSNRGDRSIIDIDELNSNGEMEKRMRGEEITQVGDGSTSVKKTLII